MKKGYFTVFIVVFALTLVIGLTEAQAQPDLVVSDLMVQDLTAAGIKIFITDTTKNLGTTTGTQMTITRYYLSTSSAIGDSIATLGDRSVPGLGHDVSNMGSNYVQIPGDTDPGGYYICAKADALNYVAESTETNNKRCKMIQIVSTGSTSLPDLIVDNLSVTPSTAAPGQLISITNKIKNLGPGLALQSRARLYLSSSCAIDSSAVPLVTRKVPTLAAGTSNQRNTGVTIPSTTTPDSYYIVAEADAFDVNTEGNETNNVACTGITIALP